jgi:hypothetical protein
MTCGGPQSKSELQEIVVKWSSRFIKKCFPALIFNWRTATYDWHCSVQDVKVIQSFAQLVLIWFKAQKDFISVGHNDMCRHRKRMRNLTVIKRVPLTSASKKPRHEGLLMLFPHDRTIAVVCGRACSPFAGAIKARPYRKQKISMADPRLVTYILGMLLQRHTLSPLIKHNVNTQKQLVCGLCPLSGVATSLFLVTENSRRWTKSVNPVILYVIYNRQNPSDSTILRTRYFNYIAITVLWTFILQETSLVQEHELLLFWRDVYLTMWQTRCHSCTSFFFLSYLNCLRTPVSKRIVE